MTETGDGLAARFEEHRGRLRAVAYRMLGSLEGADDAVQEAWIRFSAADASQVLNLDGWLTTIVTRELRPVLVNGAAGLLISLRGRPAAVMAFIVAGGRITAVDAITDPRRVRRLVSGRP